MSMVMTWLDFQLSTDNQNFEFFSDFPWNMVYMGYFQKVRRKWGI